MKKVFVYGTLRKHESNARLLENARLIAEQCWTYGKLYDVGVGYPSVTKDDQDKVYGELYEVDEGQLKALNQLEGFDEFNPEYNLYDRVEQEVFTDLGTFSAFVYIFNQEQVKGLRRIESGDWKVDRLLSQEMPLYYFAYGSCMDDSRFKFHGVDQFFQDLTGRGILVNYELKFTKKSHDGSRADIVQKQGSIVEGKVYRIGSEALEYLHDREGARHYIYRPAFVDVYLDRKVYKNVLTYLVIQKTHESAPPLHYAKEIYQGAQGCLSQEYIQGLEKKFIDQFGFRLEDLKS
ncbi:gamma-glutamylcyclotransferase [Bacillaceae bacterium S4-13-58]